MTKRTDGPISRYINRRFSMPITNFIIRKGLPITPNHISVISFLLGISSFPLFVIGHALLAGIIVQISSIIDGVDGELARAKRMTSRYGAFFDAMLDRLVDTFAIIGASIFVFLFLSTDLFSLFICTLALSGSILVSYLHARTEKEFGKHAIFFGRMPNIASRDIRLFLLFLGGITGFVLHFLALIALLSYLYLSIKFLEVCHFGRAMEGKI